MEPGSGSASTLKPSSKRPRAMVRDNDITVLYTPSVEVGPIAADVIFVHGLQGHPRKTWQAHTESSARKRSFFSLGKRKRGECGESSDPVFWPADILPDDYPNIRILTYGYDSHVSHYFKGPANKLNLSQLGEGLLNRVVGERRRSKASGRPIVFVAHSLGGLLVKEALVESQKQRPDSYKIDVYKSVQGIVFFGTPHKGSNDAKWGLILRSIASAAFDTNDKIIRALEPDSELLDKLGKDVQDIIDEGKIKICSLLESEGKTGLPVFNGKVVPDFSASFGSRKFEHLDYIEGNHINMCRFEGKDNSGYIRFLDGLAFCVETPGGVLTVENTRAGLLHSLNYGEMLAREEQLVNANVTTLDWVWSLPPGVSSLSQWLSNGTGVFWIQGKPGSGKSTLINYVKEHSQTRRRLTGAHCQSSIIIRFFFDFRARSGISNSFEGLLRSFLAQMTIELPELSPVIAEFGRDRVAIVQTEAQQEFLWSTTKLRQALLSALRACTTNILILIDGVDELEGTGRNMLDMLEFFQDLAKLDSAKRRIRICIASRPHPLIVAAFRASCGFKLQHYNNNGIKRYIDLRLKIAVQDAYNLTSIELRLTQFAEKIRQRSQGVFLWARFAVDEILVGVAEGDNEAELWTRLQALPDELQEIYARIIKRTVLACGGPEETSIMLQIAYFTCRSLTLKEFFTVVQLSLGRPSSDDSFSSVSFENRIRAKTGGLVEVVDTENTSKGRIQLIHETVRTYLDSQNGRSGVELDVEDVLVPEQKAQGKHLDHPRQPYYQGTFLDQTIHHNNPVEAQNDIMDPPKLYGDAIIDASGSTIFYGSDQSRGLVPYAKDSFKPNSSMARHLTSETDNTDLSLESSRFLSNTPSANNTTPRSGNMSHRSNETKAKSTVESIHVLPDAPQKKIKRRQAFNATQYVRTIKACIRCRMQRLRCMPDPTNPDGPCLPCQMVTSPMSIRSLLCLRYKLTDCTLNQYSCTVLDWSDVPRHKERFAGQRQARTYEEKSLVMLALKKSYGPMLNIKMRAFVLHDKVDDSGPDVVPLNAFGLESLEQAELAAKSWIDECVSTDLETILKGEDQITVLCFQAARREWKHTKANSLTEMALRMWIGARSLQDDWHIFKVEGVDSVLPMPPILRYQLEAISQMQILSLLQKSLLNELVKAITIRGNWGMVFSTIFVLLHNCDFQLRQHKSCSPIRHKMSQYPNRERRSNIENTCNILLAHFHYFCKGIKFFSVHEEVPKHLDETSKELILKLRVAISEADKHMSKYSNVETYDGKSWFSGQMFVSDWKPGSSIVNRHT